MKTLYLFAFPFVLLFSSCASIPPETVTLTDAVIKEGDRMHQLNLTLINKMFKEKGAQIDRFIRDEYTPKYLENFNAKIPEGIDVKAELPNMLASIIPEINSRRDKMQAALEEQRIKLITKLNKDYAEYEKAAASLRGLIVSGVKVNEERKKAFDQLKNLTNNKLDLNAFETELDKFIIKSGEIGSNINALNSATNSILNK